MACSESRSSATAWGNAVKCLPNFSCTNGPGCSGMEEDIAKRHGGPRIQAVTPENAPPASGVRAGLPEFIRLPRPGKRCYWTGLTRSAMNDLILGENPKVASMVLARGGADRGVRLVSLSALLDFLRGAMDEQQTGGDSQELPPTARTTRRRNLKP